MQTNIWKQWKFLQNFLLLILTPTQSCRETCCKIMNVNSSNFLKIRIFSKLCCDAGLKIVEKRQFFITLDEEEGPNEMKNLCREFSLPRSEKASRARGWILGNTKIGPVLDVKVCLHQERYGTEILIESLFRDGTASCVRNVNGIYKYLTETSETIFFKNVEHRVTGSPVIKAKLRNTRCGWFALQWAPSQTPVTAP